MVRYQYEPIVTNGQFRKLELFAGKGADPIQCALVLSTDNTGKYEAVSYTWGDESDKYAIQCNDGDLHVTRNCFHVLYHLRHESENRYLWIDAICIDQNNKDECDQQLKLAWTIYTKSSQVISFLAYENNSHSHFAMEYIRWCGELMDKIPFNPRNPKSLLQPLYVLNPLDLFLKRRGVSRQELIKEVQSIIENKYFTRAWTVQEIAVSQHCQVQYGDISIPWETFGQAARCLTPEFDSASRSWMNRKENYRGYMIHWATWKSLTGSQCGNRHAMHHNDGVETCDIWDVLRYSRFQQATHLKDKVWALHGILSRFGVILDEKYDGGEIRLFSTATFKAIKQTKSLKVFLSLPEHSRSRDLPSWVPDWAQDNPFSSHLNLEHFRACGSMVGETSEESGNAYPGFWEIES
ncbi:heterokaryon incompatibility protein-domain-containing protein [Xylariales sp. PMI_506]|nr:heterokaryon incompatibility protein-domain-containing protein [Xylariales sp. PMI_506]